MCSLSLRWLLHAIRRLILNSNSFRNLRFLWSKLCAGLLRALARNTISVVSKGAQRDLRVDGAGDGEMKWGQSHSHILAQLQGSQSPFRGIISTPPISKNHCPSPVSGSFCALDLPQGCDRQSQTNEMEGYMLQDHPLQQPTPTAQSKRQVDSAREQSASPVRDKVDSMGEMSKHAVSFSHHRIRPLVPETVARYDRNIFM
jgi:hypothetical protein